MIYHITTLNWWKKLTDSEHYESPELREEGFIHCCTAEQLKLVIHKYFKDQKDLIVLHIDPDLLESELKYEMSLENQLFPHIYGKINLNSIIDIESLFNHQITNFFDN